MLVNDLYESTQLDEIDFRQLGRKIGKGISTAGQAVGATVGGVQGAWDAAKQGYGAGQQAGRSAVGGQPIAQPVALGARELPTQTGAINPMTGRAYVPSDFPDETPGSQSGTTVTTPVAPTPTGGRSTVRQAKQAIDTAVDAISKVRSRDKQSAIAYATKAVSKIPNTLGKVSAAPPAPQWSGRTKTTPAPASKVSAPPPGGAPTAAERDVLNQKIQAALAKKPVAEALTWSKTFDPSLSLLKQIQRS